MAHPWKRAMNESVLMYTCGHDANRALPCQQEIGPPTLIFRPDPPIVGGPSRRFSEGANLGTDNLGGGTDLTDANLVGARLTGANLVGARLTGANLVGARLSGARLTGATYDRHTRFPAGFNPSTAGMRLVASDGKTRH